MISIDKRKFQPVIIFGNGFVAYKHKFFDYACVAMCFRTALYPIGSPISLRTIGFTFGKVEINGASSFFF